MGSNFSINPNFNMNNFNNSINDFNRAFSNSVSGFNENLQNSSDFGEIFNSMSQNIAPIQAGAQINDINDNVFKVENNKSISPVEKMAKDIGSGFSKGINDLNAVDKQAETDFETFASGGDISVHEVMISAQKSSLAMQMAIQLRNQMLNAYNEFKSMQI